VNMFDALVVVECEDLRTLESPVGIESLTIRTDYRNETPENFVKFVDAAIQLGECGQKFTKMSHYVIVELDRKITAARADKSVKSADRLFLFDGGGYKSVTDICERRLHISRQHYYRLLNNNPSGRRPLTPAEQAAKDEKRELADVARGDRNAAKRSARQAQDAALVKPHEEANRPLQASLTTALAANQVRENSTDAQAVSAATTAAATKTPRKSQRLVLGKTPNAVGKLVGTETVIDIADGEVNDFQHLTEPKTPRDLYFFNLGAASNVKPRTRASYEPPVPQDTDEEIPALVN
jgi:hypothetical protein